MHVERKEVETPRASSEWGVSEGEEVDEFQGAPVETSCKPGVFLNSGEKPRQRAMIEAARSLVSDLSFEQQEDTLGKKYGYGFSL